MRPGCSISGGGWSWKPPVRSPAAGAGTEVRGPAAGASTEARPCSSGRGGRSHQQTQRPPRQEANTSECASARHWASSASTTAPAPAASRSPSACSAPNDRTASPSRATATLAQAQFLDGLQEVRAELSGSLSLVQNSMSTLLAEVLQVKAELQKQAQPAQVAKADLDLSPVVAEIQAVRQVVVAEMQRDKVDLDLSPVVTEIQALRREMDLAPAIAEIQSGKADIGQVKAQLQALKDVPPLDLEPLARQVERLASEVGSLPKEIQKSRAELSPVLEAVRGAEARGLDHSAGLAPMLAELQAIRDATNRIDVTSIGGELEKVRGELQSTGLQLTAEVQRGRVDLAPLLAELRAARDCGARPVEAELAAGANQTPVLAELQHLRTQMDVLLDSTTNKLDSVAGHAASTEPTGSVLFSVDLAHDAMSGIGESSIATPGSTCRVGLETSRIGGLSCAASAYADEADEDVLDVDDVSAKIDVSKLDAALWELR